MTQETIKVPDWVAGNLRVGVAAVVEGGLGSIPAAVRLPRKCPACGSARFGGPAKVADGGPSLYGCDDCTYVHPVIDDETRPSMGLLVALGLGALRQSMRGDLAAPDPVPAAAPQRRRKDVQEGVVRELALAGAMGLTSSELRAKLGLGAEVPNTRFSEMRRKQLIMDSGTKRSGGTVWILPHQGPPTPGTER